MFKFKLVEREDPAQRGSGGKKLGYGIRLKNQTTSRYVSNFQ